MVDNAVDRLKGVISTLAIKVPCKAVASSNITLSGEQTVSSVAVVTGDRVLVIAQTSSIDNGIYDVATTAWSRSPDFDGNRDIVNGTLITVQSGSSFVFYRVTSANPIIIGTDNITFEVVNSISDPFAAGIVAKAGNYTVAAGDRGKFIVVSAAATITLPPVATIGTDFSVMIVNLGADADTVVVDGNAAETINGFATVNLLRYEYVILTNDASKWEGIISSQYISGTFTATLTGFSGSVTGTVRYLIKGNLVTLRVPSAISGTSDATGFTMTGIPAIVNPGNANFAVPGVFTDNGINVHGWAFNGVEGTIAFRTEAPISAAGWTSSGTKGLPADWTIIYPRLVA